METSTLTTGQGLVAPDEAGMQTSTNVTPNGSYLTQMPHMLLWSFRHIRTSGVYLKLATNRSEHVSG